MGSILTRPLLPDEGAIRVQVALASGEIVWARLDSARERTGVVPALIEAARRPIRVLGLDADLSIAPELLSDTTDVGLVLGWDVLGHPRRSSGGAGQLELLPSALTLTWTLDPEPDRLDPALELAPIRPQGEVQGRPGEVQGRRTGPLARISVPLCPRAPPELEITLEVKRRGGRSWALTGRARIGVGRARSALAPDLAELREGPALLTIRGIARPFRLRELAVDPRLPDEISLVLGWDLLRHATLLRLCPQEPVGTLVLEIPRLDRQPQSRAGLETSRRRRAPRAPCKPASRR